MPAITDLEFDRYLQTHVPKDQLVVVCVCSNRLQPRLGAGSVVDTLTTLYTRLNKNRSSPCERVGGRRAALLFEGLERGGEGASCLLGVETATLSLM